MLQPGDDPVVVADLRHRLEAVWRVAVTEAIDRRPTTAAVGVQQGYGWYKLTVDSPRAARRHIVLPDCEDRAIVYANGELVGTQPEILLSLLDKHGISCIPPECS